MSAIAQGRQDLARWRASVPENFFTCDANLRRVLPLYDPGYAGYAAELAAFGRAVATVIDPAATVNDRPHNHPRLDAWDGIGQRTESIEFHPSYHDAGRPAYEAGLLDGVTRPELAEPQDLVLGQMEHTRQRLERVLQSSPDFVQTHVRRVVDQLALLVQSACLLAEADWELGQGLDTDKPTALAFFVNRYVRPGYDPLEDDAYLDRLARLAETL